MRTVVESPYNPSNGRTLEENERYAILCCLDVLRMGHSPYASHVFFGRFLDEMKPAERELGMKAGFEWGSQAQICAVYTDHGITDGMKEGIKRAKALGIRVEHRELPGYDPVTGGIRLWK